MPKTANPAPRTPPIAGTATPGAIPELDAVAAEPVAELALLLNELPTDEALLDNDDKAEEAWEEADAPPAVLEVAEAMIELAWEASEEPTEEAWETMEESTLPAPLVED